jgi:plasmid stabilization system protein ParE
MTKPSYTIAARQDLTDILGYIAQDKPDAAVAWVEKLKRNVY